MFSVIIPLYNKEKQIKNTLNSVFNQTFQNFEVIVVDDGSTDESIAVLNSFSDERIHLIQQQNQGVSVARNNGVKIANFEYIAFLDADDLWEVDYLEFMANLIRQYQDCSVYASSYLLRRYDGIDKKIVLNKLPFSGKSGILSNYFEVASCSHPPLCASAIVARKEVLLSIGGFPIGIKVGEDLITWAKLALSFQIAYCKEPKAYFVQSISESYEAPPSRIPLQGDIVGKEFERLYASNKSVIGLKKYVSLWFKMRASMFLLLGDRKHAMKESLKSLKYNPTNWKVWSYLLLLIFPDSFRNTLFKKWGNQ